MNDLSESVQQSKAGTDLVIGVPTVTVFGCGGGGVNMVRKAVPHILSQAARFRYLDASVSNMRPGEEVIVVKNESPDGSGLVRKENSDAIMQKISTYTAEDLQLADINIVVFSMSGGSGSVIGPVLIREIARRKKLVVAIMISSFQSELHAKNTRDTLKTLESITTTNNIYLPVMVFNNSLGLDFVDKGLPYKIERLVDILTLPAAELDKNDRLNWINVPKTTGAAGGLRLLYVEAGQENERNTPPTDPELWPGPTGYIFDSVLNVRTVQNRHRFSSIVEARVAYDGIFTTVQNVPMIGIIGNPPDAFERLTTEIQDILQKYKAQSSKRTSAIVISDDEVDPDTGLVL